METKLSVEQKVLLSFLLGLVRINAVEAGEKTIMDVLEKDGYDTSDKFVIDTLKIMFYDEIQRWYYPENYE